MKKKVVAFSLLLIVFILFLSGNQLGTMRSIAAYKVSERDLFYKCPEYLNNSAYSSYLTKCEDRIATGMKTIDDSEKIAASILYSLENGFDIIKDEIANLAGYSDSTYNKMNKEVVYEIVQKYLVSDTTATDTVSQIGNAYSTISDAYEVTSAVELMNYKAELEASAKNLSKDQISKLVDMYTDSDSFKKLLKYAGTTQKALKLITTYIEVQDLDLSVLRELDRIYSPYDSDFSIAIKKIMTDRNSDIVTFAKNNFLKDEVLKKAVGILTKNLSDPVLLVKEISVKILGTIYAEYFPTADKIIQAGMCQSYTYLARNRVSYYQKQFQKGNATEDMISEYKVAYSFYLSTMKMTMEKVASCVNGSDKWVKDSLKDWSSALGTSLTYSDYISCCIASANDAVSKGLLTISGNSVVRKTSDGTVIDSSYNSTESITARLTEIKRQFPPNVGHRWTGSWGGCIQCYGFARMVFSKLYGCEMPARYDSSAMYRYLSEENVDLVGQVVGSNVNASSVANLFSQAKIGDVIQASGSTYGQHTMILMGISSDGIEVYDCNAAVNGASAGQCVINQWKISYASLTSWYGGASNAGISVYRASNYASIYGNGEDMFYDDSVNFVIEDGVLVKYNGWQSFVEIPDTVTVIGAEAFRNNKTMMSVTIPESVESIGNSAFYGCTSLLGVVIPDSVESIGNSAFCGCEKLASAKLPENSKYTLLNDRIFSECEFLDCIDLPNNIVEIEACAFEGCISLNGIKFNEALTKIGEAAFRGCISIETLELPKYLNELEWESFGGCIGITKIEIPKTLEKSNSFGYDGKPRFGPFSECVNLNEVVFESGTKEIAEGLFGNCTGLEKIIIPDTVTKIGRGAFSWCTNLKEIQFSSNLTEIDDNAFFHCIEISALDFPEFVTRIGACSFEECNDLKMVELPKNLTVLDWQAFGSCAQLSKVEVPKSLKRAETWGDGWYPKSGPFSKCEKLVDVIFENGVTKIADGLFGNCTGLKKVVIPDTVTEIGEGAFTYCENLQTVEMSANVKRIGYVAFRKCSMLENMVLPETLISIDAVAFGECKTFTQITIPDTVEEVGNSIFFGCENLEKIELSQNISSIEASMFKNCVSLQKVKFPENLVSIQKEAFYNCVSLEKVVLPSHVNAIYANAFEKCENLVEIELPENLRTIGCEVLKNCVSLDNLVLPNMVEKLGTNVFEMCSSLKEVKLSTALKEVPNQSFTGCSSLKSIILPYQVKSIGTDAFKNCTSLKEITIPKATTSISEDAFSYPDKITIFGVEGSYAETYAKENDIKFVSQKVSAESVSFSRTEIELEKWDEMQLVVNIAPIDFTDDVSWKSSDENVIEVKDGYIEAVGYGEADVTITVGEKSTTCKIKVVEEMEDAIPPSENVSDNNNPNTPPVPNDVDKKDEENKETTDKTSQIKKSKVVIKRLTNLKGKKIRISIKKKIKNATGYQIQYSTTKKMKKSKKRLVKGKAFTISKLKKKKKYYIRVRAYIMNGNKKIYGKWSLVKWVKVKK